MDETADIALATIRDAIPELRSVRRIRFALFGASAADTFERKLEEL